jgi:hypothetical protein
LVRKTHYELVVVFFILNFMLQFAFCKFQKVVPKVIKNAKYPVLLEEAFAFN